MKNLKINRLLHCLRPKEKRQFLDFLNLSSAKNLVAIRTLFGELCGNSAESAREKVALFPRMFPEVPAESYRDPQGNLTPKAQQKLTTCIHQLTRLVEDFLVYRHLLRDSYTRERILLKVYDVRDQPSLFLQHWKRMMAHNEQLPAESIAYHYRKWDLIRMAVHHPTQDSFPTAKLGLNDALRHLDTFFAKVKLSDSYTSMMRHLVHNQEQHTALLEPVLALSESPLLQSDEMLAAFRQVLQNFSHAEYSTESFAHLRQLVLGVVPELPQDEQYNLFRLLIHYSLVLDQFTNEEPTPSYLDLLDHGLENGYLFLLGRIYFWIFLHYIGTACRQRLPDRAEVFCDRYLARLPKETQKFAEGLGRAQIAVARGEFKVALRYLNRKERWPHFGDKLLERITCIQCYYELNEWELLEFNLESARKMIARMNPIGAMVALQFKGFLRFVRQLKTLAYEDRASPELVHVLQHERIAFFQPWLLAKAKDLVERHREKPAGYRR